MGPEANILHSAVRISSWLLWIVDSCLCLIFISAVQSIPCQSSNMWQARHCRYLNCFQSQKVLGLLCGKLHLSACSSMATRRNLRDWDIWDLALNQTLDACSSEDSIFAESDSDIDNDTDDDVDMNFTQCTDNTNCWPIVPVVQRLTEVPVGYGKQSHLTSVKTIPHLEFWLRQGRQAPSISQLKRLDTRHNRHWLMQCKRIRCHVCSAKNKETGTKFKCWECSKGCMLPDVSRYITPNCIFEDQPTLKWKSKVHMSVNITIHKCQ